MIAIPRDEFLCLGTGLYDARSLWKLHPRAINLHIDHRYGGRGLGAHDIELLQRRWGERFRDNVTQALVIRAVTAMGVAAEHLVHIVVSRRQ